MINRRIDINTSKGAIFGMDARIAIVIFSILGLVGAYYTSNKIEEAQTKSVVEQVSVLRNAAMQNIVDNGFDYKLYSSAANSNIFGVYDNASNDLVRGKNNRAYIKSSDPKSESGVTYIQTPVRNIEVDNLNLHTSTVASASSTSTNDCVNTSLDCFYWIKLSSVNEDSFKLLEEHFDGSTTGFDDASAKTTGIIVAPNVDTVNDSATVFVRIGSRRQ